MDDNEIMERIEYLNLSDKAIRFRYGDDIADAYPEWLYFNIK